jgi:hypothetical protein
MRKPVNGSDASQTPKTGTGVDRRRFLAGLALGAGVAPMASLFRSQVTAGPAANTASDLCYSSSGPVLTPQDFNLLGYYDIQTNGNDTTYMRALSHRYVNGQVRFLSLTNSGVLHEFALPSAFGQVATATTATWNISSVCNDFTGIWWEEAKQRLWVTSSVDYGNGDQYYPTRISTLTLGAGGVVSNVKTVSLQGINSKRVYGGVVPVPAWFQSQYGVGPYAVGFGGYTSLLLQTSPPSLGPELICIPDIANYGNGAEIPSSAFRVLLDAAPGTRGVRRTYPINYFDGGDPRPNPSSPPTDPPLSTADWLSPAPDGVGWMVWGDSYYNNAVWINGANKQGFVAIAALGKGKCWYQESTLHFDDRQFELHIWDAASLTRGPATRPTSMTELIIPRGIVPQPWDGDVPTANISGVTFDANASRLYAVGYPLGSDVFTGRLYTYSVNT